MQKGLAGVPALFCVTMSDSEQRNAGCDGSQNLHRVPEEERNIRLIRL
jgi:hypothetical protein